MINAFLAISFAFSEDACCNASPSVNISMFEILFSVTVRLRRRAPKARTGELLVAVLVGGFAVVGIVDADIVKP